MSQQSCVVIIPVYNEKDAIAQTCKRVLETVKKIPSLEFEVICVDDGSTDGTREILEKEKQITLITHRFNRGYGAALRTGLDLTNQEWIIILDADGTYPIEILPELLKDLDDVDMVVGARRGEGIDTSPLKRLARYILRKTVHMLTGEMVPDLNSGMRAFRRSVYEEFKHLLPMGFSFTTTITVASLYSGFMIRFVPIEYYVRIGKSNIKPIQNFIGFLMLIVRLASYFDPLRFFVPLALVIWVIGFLKGMQDLALLNHMGNLSVIMMLSAMQVLLTGVLCDVIVRRSYTGTLKQHAHTRKRQV